VVRSDLVLNANVVGAFALCSSLVAAGMSVNIKDHDGRTPLHCAATAGNLAIVTFLLDRGANINAVDRYNVSALEEAEKIGNRVCHARARSLCLSVSLALSLAVAVGLWYTETLFVFVARCRAVGIAWCST
jgi:potassium channel